MSPKSAKPLSCGGEREEVGRKHVGINLISIINLDTQSTPDATGQTCKMAKKTHLLPTTRLHDLYPVRCDTIPWIHYLKNQYLPCAVNGNFPGFNKGILWDKRRMHLSEMIILQSTELSVNLANLQYVVLKSAESSCNLKYKET